MRLSTLLLQVRPPQTALDMVVGGTLATQTILVLLALLSFTSWWLIFRKWQQFREVRHEGDRFLEYMEQAQRLEDAYGDHDEAFVYDDAVEMVKGCRAEGWKVGLLSGNIRRAAENKLQRFGLWEMFEFGLFGDDARNREDLVWMAEEASWEALGESYTHDRMVLVGDTAEDAKAAKSNAVRSLIVCRRPETKERIQSARPTWLVDSLEETERIIAWMKAE